MSIIELSLAIENTDQIQNHSLNSPETNQAKVLPVWFWYAYRGFGDYTDPHNWVKFGNDGQVIALEAEDIMLPIFLAEKPELELTS